MAQCDAPFADCDDAAGNGCETDTSSAADHCGGCGAACPRPANATATCASATCRFVCAPSFADCNQQPGDGCEVNLKTSAAHCGACERRCAAPHASSACDEGQCTLTTCDGAFGDCNSDDADGCETNLTTDPAHCGSCGTPCPAIANGAPGCGGGQCTVGACTGTFADCNGVAADGCETDLASTVAHCGGCQQPCQQPPNGVARCTIGVCAVASCHAGFADCNGVAADGCEVDLRSDPQHCGHCGTACALANATAVCSAGACVISSCQSGWHDCDGLSGTGCERATSADVTNCGGCGLSCAVANGTPLCLASTCGIASCASGFNDCVNGYADGCETDSRVSVTHCGQCGHACAAVANGTPACADGQCGIGTCTAPWRDCDGQAPNGCETNTQTGIDNCGACNTRCAVANGVPQCSAGRCGIAACSTPHADCNTSYADGCETNLSTTPTHCGACNRACSAPNALSGCAAGSCTVASCNPGFANCNVAPADGCEVSTQTDVVNCGGCGRACPVVTNGTRGCANGVCGIASCNLGYGNCDNLVSTGCETNTQTNPSHCGGCNLVCPGVGAVCYRGSCRPSVLIVGSPTPTNDSWLNDVKAKLDATGAFRAVDVFNARLAVPSAQQLALYDSVLVFSDAAFLDRVALGDALATFFDAGGRVVVATFAHAAPALALGGRWATEGYHLINPAGMSQAAETAPVQIVEPGSPLLTGVTTLSATAAFRSSGAVINGGVVVARWGNSSAPLVVRGTRNGRAFAALNFYPPSITVRADFWSGDGANLMRNALKY